MARGHVVDAVPEMPLVVDGSVEASVDKTKSAVALLKALGAEADADKCAASKKLRAGKGKMRNRRYRPQGPPRHLRGQGRRAPPRRAQPPRRRPLPHRPPQPPAPRARRPRRPLLRLDVRRLREARRALRRRRRQVRAQEGLQPPP